ncbi:hypothetical protein NIES22_00950 [Calothrix brevissima NIES-22]|nr:hypothetical protein NIES22_00950 [Calothrix brevissima NIES-22]
MCQSSLIKEKLLLHSYWIFIHIMGWIITVVMLHNIAMLTYMQHLTHPKNTEFFIFSN